MKIATLNDYSHIKEMLLKHWHNVSDDYSNPENIYFDPSKMICFIDDNFLATAVPITHTIADCHLISKRPDTVERCLEAFEMLKNVTSIRSLLLHAPTYNEPANKLALKLDFKLLGLSEKSIIKDSVLKDQNVYVRCI